MTRIQSQGDKLHRTTTLGVSRIARCDKRPSDDCCVEQELWFTVQGGPWANEVVAMTQTSPGVSWTGTTVCRRCIPDPTQGPLPNDRTLTVQLACSDLNDEFTVTYSVDPLDICTYSPSDVLTVPFETVDCNCDPNFFTSPTVTLNDCGSFCNTSFNVIFSCEDPGPCHECQLGIPGTDPCPQLQLTIGPVIANPDCGVASGEPASCCIDPACCSTLEGTYTLVQDSDCTWAFTLNPPPGCTEPFGASITQFQQNPDCTTWTAQLNLGYGGVTGPECNETGTSYEITVDGLPDCVDIFSNSIVWTKVFQGLDATCIFPDEVTTTCVPLGARQAFRSFTSDSEAKAPISGGSSDIIIFAPEEQSLEGSVTISGNIAQNRFDFNQSLSAAIPITGNITSTHNNFEQLASSATVSVGNIIQTDNNFEQSLSGTVEDKIVGDVVQDHSNYEQDLDVDALVQGTAIQDHNNYVQDSSADTTIAGDILQDYNNFEQSLSGIVEDKIVGDITQEHSNYEQSLTASTTHQGDIVQDHSNYVQDLDATVVLSGDIIQDHNNFLQTLSGSVADKIVGDVTQDHSNYEQSLTASVSLQGDIAQDHNNYEQTLAGISPAQGDIAEDFSNYIQDISASNISSGDIAQDENNYEQTLSGAVSDKIVGDISQDENNYEQSVSADVAISGDIAVPNNAFLQNLEGNLIQVSGADITQTHQNYDEALEGLVLDPGDVCSSCDGSNMASGFNITLNVADSIDCNCVDYRDTYFVPTDPSDGCVGEIDLGVPWFGQLFPCNSTDANGSTLGWVVVDQGANVELTVTLSFFIAGSLTYSVQWSSTVAKPLNCNTINLSLPQFGAAPFGDCDWVGTSTQFVAVP